MGRLVTVFCDASFGPDGRAGYAVWAKCEGRTFRYSGQFRTRAPANSAEAEFAAAANALHLAARHFAAGPEDRLLLQSDNMEVVGVLTQQHRPSSDLKREVLDHVARLREATGGIIIRHVKAHLHNDAGRRHAVNNWVDRASRAARLTVLEDESGAPIDVDLLGEY